MSKLNVRFPTNISFGAVGGPAFSTDVIVLGSGFESRNQNWSQARCMWDVAKACRDRSQAEELIAFFRVAKGRAHSFRFKDFTDYEVADGEGTLVQTGALTWQLYKVYTNSAGSDSHKIIFPVESTFVLKAGITTLLAGSPGDYSLDDETGVVTMNAGSPTVTPTSWTGEFDRHVRFDVDRLQLQVEGINTFFRANQIMIVEERD